MLLRWLELVRVISCGSCTILPCHPDCAGWSYFVSLSLARYSLVSDYEAGLGEALREGGTTVSMEQQAE